MIYLPLTRAIQFYPFTTFMDNIGIPVTSLLDKYGIPRSLLSEPELLIDEMKFQRLAVDVEKKEGLPGFGYLVGKDMALSDLGDLAKFYSPAQPFLSPCARFVRSSAAKL